MHVPHRDRRRRALYAPDLQRRPRGEDRARRRTPARRLRDAASDGPLPVPRVRGHVGGARGRGGVSRYAPEGETRVPRAAGPSRRRARADAHPEGVRPVPARSDRLRVPVRGVPHDLHGKVALRRHGEHRQHDDHHRGGAHRLHDPRPASRLRPRRDPPRIRAQPLWQRRDDGDRVRHVAQRGVHGERGARLPRARLRRGLHAPRRNRVAPRHGRRVRRGGGRHGRRRRARGRERPGRSR